MTTAKPKPNDKQAGYLIGETGKPVAAGVVCRCGEPGFCPMHGTRALPPSKLSQLKAHLAAGDAVSALRIAARFPALGAAKEPITRAWAAHTNPETYRAMGHDPAALFAAGIKAIRERYGL